MSEADRTFKRDTNVRERSLCQIASAYVRAASFDRFDRDHDGVITRAKWDAGETARFERIDGDGVVTREEFLRDRAQARSQ